jgi:hypothetical protein
MKAEDLLKLKEVNLGFPGDADGLELRTRIVWSDG